LNPKAVNAVGEIKTVDRAFSGYEHFFDAIITDLCARSEMTRPMLFYTPSKGFSDNTTESLLKESEMIRMRQRQVEPLLNNCTKILTAHTFGVDSEEYGHVDDLYMSFDKPVVATDKDKAEIGARYFAAVNSAVQAGMRTDDALQLAKQFFPAVRLSVDILENAKEDRNLGIKAPDARVPDDGVDMRGQGSRLDGKAPQVRSDVSTTSKPAKDSLLSRITEFFKSKFSKKLTPEQMAAIMEEVENEN
jgi:hypothetical protein